MSKKGSFMTYLKYLCIIAAFLMAGSGFRGDFLVSHGSGDLLAQGMKSKISDILTVIDFAGEADAKGFKITHIPQQLFTKFMVISKGLKIAEIPVPLSGSTTEGIVYVNSILPLSLPKESVIYIWKNGKETPVTRAAEADHEVDIQVPLDKGTNYLCFVVKNSNKWWGRSRILKVESPGVVIEEKKEPPVPPKAVINDYWEEANQKGFKMPAKDSIIGFIGFNTTSHGSIITDLPSPLSGSTNQGIIDSMLVLPKDLTGANNSVYLWSSGEQMLISRSGKAADSVLSKLVLGNGANYVCGIIMNGTKYVGRTPMVKIT